MQNVVKHVKNLSPFSYEKRKRVSIRINYHSGNQTNKIKVMRNEKRRKYNIP